MTGTRKRRAASRLSMTDALMASPAYAYAALVHAVILLVLSFIGVARYFEEPPHEFEVSLASLAEVTVEEPEQAEPRELEDAPPLPPEVDVDSLSDATLGDSSAVDAPLAPSLQGLRGLAGRAGRGEGGSENAGGGTRSSYAARDAGLAWLAQHRNAQGLWSARPWHPGEAVPQGRNAQTGLAHSSLALLAFLAAGHSPVSEGPYQELMLRARAGLLEAERATTLIGMHQQYYVRPIFLMACAELLKANPADEDLVRSMRSQIRYLTATRGPNGWRYSPSSRIGDTSVNAWVGLSLKAAESAGLHVSPKNYSVIRTYLRSVTGSDGRTGYALKGHRANPAMNASGLFLRIMLGESPSTSRNRNAVKLLTRNTDGLREGLYSIYYQSLALHQVGGEGWLWFNPRAREFLIGAQEQTGCERGSWTSNCHWISSRVNATALAVLTLEVYDRYVPVHLDGNDLGARGAQSEEWNRLSKAVRSAERTVDAALLAKQGGALLAAEAELSGMLSLVADSELAQSDKSALARTCHQALIELAVEQDDADLIAQRVGAWQHAFPEEKNPSLIKLGLQAKELQLHRGATQLIEAGHRADPDAVQACLRELERFVAQRREGSKEFGPRLAAALIFDTLQEAEAVQAAGEWVAAHDPNGEHPADAVERRWLGALATAAQKALQLAAKDGTEAERREGERLRELVAARHVETRAARFAKQLKPLLAAIETLRPYALLATGKPREAAVLAKELGGLENVERSALLTVLRDEGALKGAERARAIELLQLAPPQGDSERLAYASVLVELDPAAGLEALAALADSSDPTVRIGARLKGAELARLAGDLARARGLIASCPDDLFAVRLERARLAAVTDRGQAIAAYQSLLRALVDEHPELWWEVAEELVLAYVGWGERETAFQFLDGLRKRDATFGGDDTRRRRLIKLLAELM